MASITIAGDMAPMGRNVPIFQSRAFRDLTELGLSSTDDFMIANLECVLSDAGAAIMKQGPNLRAPAGTAGGLRQFGVSAVNLANNHIMDYGVTGLNATTECLDREGITWFGAGGNSSEAVRPFSFNAGNSPCKVFGFAESEFSVSTDTQAGASPFDTAALVRALKGVSPGSFVIVLLHAGNEHYEFPNPWLRDRCRLAVELGASVVVCQHSHCIGCYEYYAGGVIVYGQGNFVFDSDSLRKSWWLGLLVRLNVEGGVFRKVEFLPFRQDPGQSIITPLSFPDKDILLASFEERSNILMNEDAYRSKWDEFCEKNRREYESLLFGFGRFARRANRLVGLSGFVSRRGKVGIGNALRCQSHLEALRQLYSQEKTC